MPRVRDTPGRRRRTLGDKGAGEALEDAGAGKALEDAGAGKALEDTGIEGAGKALEVKYGPAESLDHTARVCPGVLSGRLR